MPLRLTHRATVLAFHRLKFVGWLGGLGLCLFLLRVSAAVSTGTIITTPPTTVPTGGTGIPTTTNTCQSSVPSIVRDPQSMLSATGATVVLTVEVSGTPPFGFQWFKDGVALAGATGPELTLASIDGLDEGLYHVSVGTCAGSVASLGAWVLLIGNVVDLPDPGTVVNFTGALLPKGLTNIVAISAGAVHAVALRRNGTVVAWGNSQAEALGVTSAPANLIDAVSVCAGDDFCLALRLGGQVVGWGAGQCATIPEGLTDVTAIAAGPQRALALKSDGTVIEWGNLETLPSDVTGAAAIAVAGDYSLVAGRDGTVQVHGWPPPSLSSPPTNVQCLTGDSWWYALKADGTVAELTVGGPQTPLALAGVKAVSARHGRYLALQASGLVTGWGNVTVPPELTNVTAVAAGGLYCLALTPTPPAPRLSMRVSATGQVQLTAPVAVSGYELEATPNLTDAFQLVDFSREVSDYGTIENPVLTLNATNTGRIFRLNRP